MHFAPSGLSFVLKHHQFSHRPFLVLRVVLAVVYAVRFGAANKTNLAPMLGAHRRIARPHPSTKPMKQSGYVPASVAGRVHRLESNNRVAVPHCWFTAPHAHIHIAYPAL